jgi:hypothetical protein
MYLCLHLMIYPEYFYVPGSQSTVKLNICIFSHGSITTKLMTDGFAYATHTIMTSYILREITQSHTTWLPLQLTYVT